MSNSFLRGFVMLEKHNGMWYAECILPDRIEA